MNHYSENKQPGSRRFRILVAGRLGEGFADGFDGINQEDIGACTVLTGRLIDQSHIFGIFDRLRHLGIEVRRFETYWPDDPDSPSLKRTNQEEL